MSKKTLLILLLALLLVSGLFASSLALGGRGAGSGPGFDPQSPGMQRIRSLFSRPASPQHLSLRSGSAADCRLEGSRITVRAGRSCVFAVTADRYRTRRLTLARPPSTQRPGSLEVTLEQSLSGQDSPLKFGRSLAPAQAVDPLDIFAGKDSAATLTIIGRGLPLIDPTEYVIVIE